MFWAISCAECNTIELLAWQSHCDHATSTLQDTRACKFTCTCGKIYTEVYNMRLFLKIAALTLLLVDIGHRSDLIATQVHVPNHMLHTLPNINIYTHKQIHT